MAQHKAVAHGRQSESKSEAAIARAIELNRQGRDCIAAKQFEQAKALFKRAIQSNSRLSDAYENLALLLLLDGDDSAAEHTARKLLGLAPDNYNARFVAGVAAINRNSLRRGRDFLAPLVWSGARDPLVTTAYEVALNAGGEKAEAARLSATSAKLKVETPDALLAGQIFRQPKLKAIAQKWMEASISNADDAVNPDLLYVLATKYAEQGRTADAVALYTRLLESDSINVDALVELSELERAIGQNEKSNMHLYAAKTAAATDPSALVHFSQICMRRHMYVDARDALKKVIAQDQLNRYAWYQLGLAQFRIGEPEAAEKAFRASLALDEYDEWPRIGLGAVLLSTSRPSEAAVEFQRVLQRDRHCAAAHYYLGQLYRAAGDIPHALRELQQAVDDASEDARPWAALGQLQLAQHDLLAARESLQKAIGIDPGYAPAHYHIAMLLNAIGEKAAALKEFELFNKYHEEEMKKGIVGLVSEGKWDYAGFLPSN